MSLRTKLLMCAVFFGVLSCAVLSPSSKSISRKLTSDGITCWDGLYNGGYGLLFTPNDTMFFYSYAKSDGARIYEPIFVDYWDAVFLWKVRDSSIYIMLPDSKEVVFKLKIIRFGKEQLYLYDEKGIFFDEPDSFYFFKSKRNVEVRPAIWNGVMREEVDDLPLDSSALELQPY